MKSDDDLIGIYAKPKDSDFKWVHIKSIDFASNVECALSMASGRDSTGNIHTALDRLMVILLDSDFAIRGSERLLNSLGMRSNNMKEWMTFLSAHVLLFEVTSYRQKLVIGRLIVEFNLWTVDWIHLILERQKRNKPMLVWLVEDRKVTQLYDHYRVYKSVDVKSSALLKRRWLRFIRTTPMTNTTGFDDSDEACYEMTSYEADSEGITSATTSVVDSVRQITAKNAKLFGNRRIILHEFGSTLDQIRNDFIDALQVDQYSNGCIIVNDSPNTMYSFRAGQEVQFGDGAKGEITRIATGHICVRIRMSDDLVHSFRWISIEEAPKQLTLAFKDQNTLSGYCFAATIGGNEKSIIASTLKGHQADDVESYFIPCRGLSSYQSDIANIGIYAKPNLKGYDWARIKTTTYPPSVDQMDTKRPHSAGDGPVISVNQLMELLMTIDYEIGGGMRAIFPSNPQFARDEKSVSYIAAHPLLFEVTSYRRKLVIERLIVELKLWSTTWIHRILKQKMKDKPMLQWLVEDRRLPKLHDHYRVHTSRFTTHHSALLNQRWIQFKKNTKMSGKPGFGRLRNSCFQLTEYKADGVPFPPNIPAISGAVHEITVSNSQLFGNEAVVLQTFETKEGNDYAADDFAHALCLNEKRVVLNCIPSTTYPFCVGQEVHCNNGSTGTVSQITTHSICIKFESETLRAFRWYDKPEITGELTLAFRYREQLRNYKFAAGRRVTRNLNYQTFDDIAKFEISCESMSLSSGDPLFIYAKPADRNYRESDYKGICIKSLCFTSDSDLDDVITSPDNTATKSQRISRFLNWLRQRASKIEDGSETLQRFGLDRNKWSEWMPTIIAYPALFAVTAYQKRILIERLIVELDLMNPYMVPCTLVMGPNGKQLLEYLEEDRKIQKLYEHYRALTSGFRVKYYSELLHRTWLEFEKNTKMDNNVKFKFADDSIFQETEYMLNDVVYPMGTTVTNISMMGFPRQRCRNAELFGEGEFTIPLFGQIAPIPMVASKTPREQLTWFQNDIIQRKCNRLELKVFAHRGHYGSCKPENLLESGTSCHYNNDGKGPSATDWILFEQLTQDAVPTTILIWNYADSNALRAMKIFGSADNVVFEEWIQIHGILKSNVMMQRFHLDAASVYYAWRNRFRYFRLCSLYNYGGSYTCIYEFGMRGIMLTSQGNSMASLDFVKSLTICNDRKTAYIGIGSSTMDIGEKVQVKEDDMWIDATVCRKTADHLCARLPKGDIVSYKWVQREDIPMKLRYFITDRDLVSQHIFGATMSSSDGVPVFSHLFTFTKDEDFVIPESAVVAASNTADELHIYAAPLEKNTKLYELKTIKCGNMSPSTFVVDNAFDIDRNFMVKSNGEISHLVNKFEVLATSKIFISKTGFVDVSCRDRKGSAETKKKCIFACLLNYGEYVGNSNACNGVICLISGEDIVNEGTILCKESSIDEGGTVYIDTDGVFENKGVIDCGENGFVHIRCSEFKDVGTIIPKPMVSYRRTRTVHKVTKQLSSGKNHQHISLKVSNHKGHYRSDGPSNLLQNGTASYYYSNEHDKESPLKDWITFEMSTKQRVLPTSIVIRNYGGNYGLKTVKIPGSANGQRFNEWIKIEGIRNKHKELQTFAVSPLSAYFAWERAYTFFKLDVVDNHGATCDIFYEFRINGMVEQ